jgi:flagellar biogenesis protein FliO
MILALWLQTTPSGAVDTMHSINGQFWDVVKLLFILAGILLLAVVVIKHWLPRLVGGVRTSIGPMSVVARYSLEPRKTLYIVRAGSKYFLLGSAEGQISSLAELPAASVEPALAGEAGPPADRANPGVMINFSDLMGRLRRPRRSA